MTERLDLPPRYRHIVKTLLHEQCPIPRRRPMAAASRVRTTEAATWIGRCTAQRWNPWHCAPKPHEAFRAANLPILVQVDWTMIESFRNQIARSHIVLQEGPSAS